MACITAWRMLPGTTMSTSSFFRLNGKAKQLLSRFAARFACLGHRTAACARAACSVHYDIHAVSVCDGNDQFMLLFLCHIHFLLRQAKFYLAVCDAAVRSRADAGECQRKRNACPGPCKVQLAFQRAENVCRQRAGHKAEHNVLFPARPGPGHP